MIQTRKSILTGMDPLKDLHSGQPFAEKLDAIHAAANRAYPFIDRISVSLYDPETEILKTFIKSGLDNPIHFYGCNIADAPSLKEIRDTQRPRLVNDLNLFRNGTHTHTRQLAAMGYNASYTVPIFSDNELLGIVFFNSYTTNAFTEPSLSLLNVYAQLINGLIISRLASVRAILGAFRSALNMVSNKDPETGNHLERMSRYAELIARHLAITGNNAYELTDEIIEHLFIYSPLHDIGKIGIPDSILLKNGALDDQEWQVMKTHARKGIEIINEILDQPGLPSFEHTRLLAAITESHHETIDGQGYPMGLKGEEVPIEAMIVSVADIFDALTNKRTYKKAWSNDDAFNELKRLAGTKLNAGCVDTLIAQRETVEAIQRQFADA